MEKLPPPNSRPIVSCIWIILPHWRDLRVFADALDGEVYHYRDKNGLECDAVVHLHNGKYGLVEVKLGGDKLINEGAANLLTLAGKEQGTTVIISSHNLNFVADISSRILLLEKGKLVKDLQNTDGAAIAELNTYFGIQAE